MIDAHVHFWDPDRWDYPWLDEVPALRRPYLPADLLADGPNPDGVVVVEAGGGSGDPLAEVAWVEDLATRWPAIVGVVAHAPLEQGADIAPLLQRLSERPLVKGIRRNLQDERDGFALTQRFRAGVRLLADYGLVADLCARERQLVEVTQLVRSTPEVTFVLDHLGKPDIRAGQWQPWADNLTQLAEQPNVVAKLSGLATEADWDTWEPRRISPYLRHALAVFGPHRCMFGGDWPVSTLATRYSDWLHLVASVLAEQTPDNQAQVFGAVAARVYRLAVSPPIPTTPR